MTTNDDDPTPHQAETIQPEVRRQKRRADTEPVLSIRYCTISAIGIAECDNHER